MRSFTFIAALLLSLPVAAQEPAKPGPEHEILKKMEGNWETVMAAGGAEFKGIATYKMELGGLWLIGTLDTDMGGMKFTGKSLETFDAAKKKYTSIWVDSMSTGSVHMESTYDAAKKTLTAAGEGPGMDGKNTKFKSVSDMSNPDKIVMTMWMGDGKDPAFVITYSRKK
jgi:Protein of unknown function (DUF1579)